jgi:N-acetylmuramoyl-L-alanine amidase
MRRLRRVVSFSNAVLCMAFLAVLPSLRAEGNRWDPEGAARAFEDARRMRNDLSQETLPVLSRYLECVRKYRKVHVRDPHYGRTGDAIYEEGLVYEEMGDKFTNTDFYRTAAKRFQLLIKEYGGNRNCPDALLRMGDINLKFLNDEVAAQNAYRILRANYRSSSASRQLAARHSAAPLPASRLITPVPVSPSTVPEASPTVKSVPPATTFVQSIRHWSTSDYTRVIIDLDSTAHYSAKRLSNPDRLYFTISEAKLSNQMGAKILAVEDEFLKQIRISQNTPETVRVVLELSTKSDHTVSEMIDPFRIVVDLRRPGTTNAALRSPPADAKAPPESAHSKTDAGQSLSKPRTSQPVEDHSPGAGLRQPPRAVTEIQSIPSKAPKPKAPVLSQASAAQAQLPEVFAKDKKQEQTAPASAKKQPAATVPIVESKPTGALPASSSRPADPTSLGDRTLTRMLGLKIGRIVIDPGHGGHDMGTIGQGGLLEKDLVLSIALDLQRLLERNLGAEVILTRSDDTFISLEERSAISNRFRADLFISIHANSSSNRSISGVETYYLNFARTDAEREIASRENATSTSNINELEDLIKKIAQADKATESKELASIIQKNLYSGVKKMIPKAQDRGVRSAPFVVLIGANMPSILTEVAFISNPRDERLLKKTVNQERLVRALFSGIEGYMKTLGSDMAQNQPHGN